MKPKILIVDDELEIRENLVKIFEFSNYTVYSAKDGLEALHYARIYLPDIILTDIMMPNMDGLELLSNIQQDVDLAGIPVLLLTARADQHAIKKSLKLGAEVILTKPFDIDELLSNVEIRLDKKRKREKHLKSKIEILQSNLSRSLPHEVRTPLNAVLGYSDFLKNNFTKLNNDEIFDMLSEINKGGKRLQRILDNFLYYANLEHILNTPSEKIKESENIVIGADKYIVDITLMKLYEDDRVDDLNAHLEDVDLKISEKYLSKLIEEIIDNAIKFSKPKTPIVLKGIKKQDYYHLQITDYGIGFTKEQIDMVDAYIQFNRKFNEQQGIGLGIAIVKDIVNIFDGKYYIESEEEKFTTINIFLKYHS